MSALSCDCGFSAQDENRYKVEATMWHHAFHHHVDFLQSMSIEQLEAWLQNKDQRLSMAE